VLFLSTAVVVVLGTVQAVRNSYQVQPSFKSVGLDYDVESNGVVTVEPLAGSTIDGRWRIVAINSSPVPADIRSGELARRLEAAGGKTVTLELKTRSDKLVRVQQPRDTSLVEESARRARDFRVSARLASGLLACVTLLLCSFLLVRRRPADPVASLFSFAFAGMAATIDPPLAMWMAMGWPPIYDILSSGWFYLLLIALATFPDGIFVPKSYRWILAAGIPLAVVVSLPQVNGNIQVFLGIGALLAMLVGQAIRYRRLSGGIEKQQLKWAAFGFASGLLLVFAAFVLLLFLPEDSGAQSPILSMSIVLLFSVGMAVIPLGLLIALTRYRLWEADTVITRSAAFAVVSAIVGVVWAISTDLAKFVIASTMGQEHQASATAVGAIIAAGIFGPAQSVIMGWTRRRFGGPGEILAELPEKLREWSLVETPSEIAARTLARIERAIHPAYAAVTLGVDPSSEIAAIGDVRESGDPRDLPLVDEGNRIGTLFIGHRSDGNPYTRATLASLDDLLEPIARALRATAGRHSREEQMQQMIDQMAARLAQLEGGEPKPA
jgi:MFS family permease